MYISSHSSYCKLEILSTPEAKHRISYGTSGIRYAQNRENINRFSYANVPNKTPSAFISFNTGTPTEVSHPKPYTPTHQSLSSPPSSNHPTYCSLFSVHCSFHSLDFHSSSIVTPFSINPHFNVPHFSK